MTPEKLADLIDRYGSAMETWPNPEPRTAAEALLRCSEAARTVLRRARGLERCLRPPESSLIDRAAESAGSELLIARILEQARRTPQAPPSLAVRLREGWLLLLEAADRRWLSYGLPAALALALGIVVGEATLDRGSYASLQPGLGALITSTHSIGAFEL